MNGYLYAFKHALHFSGRTQRRLFWEFMLIHLIASAGVIYVEVATDNLGWIDLVYSAITLLPMLSMLTRRLRDTGLSMWWFLIVLVPGGVAVLVFLMALPSTVSQSELTL
ncbi:hypothetical protein DN730_05880 [Marinomonas piezotolerans]|uniref:DUF805 domain-containing protein n=1 Tax=Marinomonas piezotolerans TaxID=2213058 RepID=A0A370UBH0_9GAMM|nr:DUF805 domain-containing protein [Marinomonas piezotolerans]RDL45140.1 hypothetical protein DN730_05880 [Marinomonas piezotolerans]